LNLGAHCSTQGGVSRALERAAAIGCGAVQIFTKNNNRWAEKPLDPGEVRRFRAAARGFKRRYLFAHDGYLINLASPRAAILKRSLVALVDEIRRAELLGLSYVVTHPGAHLGKGEEWGVARVARSLDLAHAETAGARVRVLLETTAGQGTSLGWRFEHLAEILARVEAPERLGVCVDTCHIFAAGYDIRTEGAYEETMRRLLSLVGRQAVRAFHLNDSSRDLGSRVDRHAQIGKGKIGLGAFRALVNDPRFRDRPMVLETPKGKDMKEDVVNLRVLRGLRAKV
jgi:deoxyribonuclease-4